MLEWTDSGLELLSTIHDYINRNGGARELLKKINQEEREIRRKEYINSYAAIGGYSVRKDRKKVKIIKGSKRLYFKNTTIAADFLRVNTANIRVAVRLKSRCRGWNCEYIL